MNSSISTGCKLLRQVLAVHDTFDDLNYEIVYNMTQSLLERTT